MGSQNENPKKETLQNKKFDPSKDHFIEKIGSDTLYIKKQEYIKREKDPKIRWKISLAYSKNKNRLFIAKWYPFKPSEKSINQNERESIGNDEKTDSKEEKKKKENKCKNIKEFLEEKEKKETKKEFELQIEFPNFLPIALKNYVVSLDKYKENPNYGLLKGKKNQDAHESKTTEKLQKEEKPQKGQQKSKKEEKIQYLLVYELFVETTLKQFLDENKGQLKLNKRCILACLIGNAINALHKSGISHNNINKYNILVMTNPLEIKLCGLSKAVKNTLEQDYNPRQKFDFWQNPNSLDVKNYLCILKEIFTISEEEEEKKKEKEKEKKNKNNKPNFNSEIILNKIKEIEKKDDPHINYIDQVNEFIIEKLMAKPATPRNKSMAENNDNNEAQKEGKKMNEAYDKNELLQKIQTYFDTYGKNNDKTNKNEIKTEEGKIEEEKKEKREKQEEEMTFSILPAYEIYNSFIQLKILHEDMYVKELEIIDRKDKNQQHLTLTEIDIKGIDEEIKKGAIKTKEIGICIENEIKYQKSRECLKIRKLEKVLLTEQHDKLFLFYEFLNGGKLKDLGTQANFIPEQFNLEKEKQIISIDIHRGITELLKHSTSFQQIDPSYIWLRKDIYGDICEAKIHDFGLMKTILKLEYNKIINEPSYNSVEEYIAPELVQMKFIDLYSNEEQLTKELITRRTEDIKSAYVFCYGLILYYLLYGDNPLSEESNREKFINASFGIYGNMFNFRTLQIESTFQTNLLSLIKECLYFYPLDRIALDKIPKDKFFELPIFKEELLIEDSNKVGGHKTSSFKEDHYSLINERNNKGLQIDKFIDTIKTINLEENEGEINKKQNSKDESKTAYLIETYSKKYIEDSYFKYSIQERIHFYQREDVKEKNLFQNLLRCGHHKRNQEEYFSLVFQGTMTLWDAIQKKNSKYKDANVLFNVEEIRTIALQLICSLTFLHKKKNHFPIRSINLNTIYVCLDDNCRITKINHVFGKSKVNIENSSVKLSLLPCMESKYVKNNFLNFTDKDMLFVDPLIFEKKEENIYSSDFWSLAMIMYFLCFGRPPSYKYRKLKIMRKEKYMKMPYKFELQYNNMPNIPKQKVDETDGNKCKEDDKKDQELLEILIPKIMDSIKFCINQLDDRSYCEKENRNYSKLFYADNIFPYEKDEIKPEMDNKSSRNNESEELEEEGDELVPTKFAFKNNSEYSLIQKSSAKEMKDNDEAEIKIEEIKTPKQKYEGEREKIDVKPQQVNN